VHTKTPAIDVVVYASSKAVKVIPFNTAYIRNAISGKEQVGQQRHFARP
jgi:hypothetical protein